MNVQTDIFPARIACRIWHDEALLREFTPTQAGHLRTRITIAALGESAWGDFSAAFYSFAAGVDATERHACVACKTIEKFGGAIQFREDFVVEFQRLP